MGKISNIPKLLRDGGLFCCWRFEDKNGRKTKIPYNPVTGQRAQTNNPNTFADFQTALGAAQGYNGIGFLITDGLFVIDCDHCKTQNGHLSQIATDICALFDGCYMEWSPSGEGLHIIGKASGFDFDKKIYGSHFSSAKGKGLAETAARAKRSKISVEKYLRLKR